MSYRSVCCQRRILVACRLERAHVVSSTLWQSPRWRTGWVHAVVWWERACFRPCPLSSWGVCVRGYRAPLAVALPTLRIDAKRARAPLGIPFHINNIRGTGTGPPPPVYSAIHRYRLEAQVLSIPDPSPCDIKYKASRILTILPSLLIVCWELMMSIVPVLASDQGPVDLPGSIHRSLNTDHGQGVLLVAARCEISWSYQCNAYLR